MERFEFKPGVAPSLQLREKRRETGRQLVYLPHQGAREKARRRRAMEKRDARRARENQED